MVFYVVYLSWIVHRIVIFKKAGKSWTSPQVVIFELVALYCIAREVRAVLMFWFNDWYQLEPRQGIDMLMYWWPIWMLLAAFMVMLHIWASILKRFEESNLGFFRVLDKALAPFALIVFLALGSSYFTFGNTSTAVFLAFANGPTALTMMLISFAVLKTSKEVNAVLSNVHSASNNKRGDALVERINNLATRATKTVLLALVLMGTFSSTLVFGVFPGSWYCESVFFLFRVFEAGISFQLLWALRGERATSETNTPNATSPVAGTPKPSETPKRLSTDGDETMVLPGEAAEAGES